MSAISDFIEFYEHHEPRSQDNVLADEYNDASASFEAEQQILLKSLRVDKADFKPVFSSDIEEIASRLNAAEARLNGITGDIEHFLRLTGGENSSSGLIEQLTRARRTIANVKIEANAIRERTVRQNLNLMPIEAEQLEVVQPAFDRRDRILAELEPVVMNLQGRLTEIKAILGKYDSDKD